MCTLYKHTILLTTNNIPAGALLSIAVSRRMQRYRFQIYSNKKRFFIVQVIRIQATSTKFRRLFTFSYMVFFPIIKTTEKRNTVEVKTTWITRMYFVSAIDYRIVRLLAEGNSRVISWTALRITFYTHSQSRYKAKRISFKLLRATGLFVVKKQLENRTLHWILSAIKIIHAFSVRLKKYKIRVTRDTLNTNQKHLYQTIYIHLDSYTDDRLYRKYV